jgi:protein-S-isoprenylcysteine O-methyltransferase Ste14
MEIFGKATISGPWFITAKISLILCLIMPGFRKFSHPYILYEHGLFFVIAGILFSVGGFILLIAFFNLGKSLAVGLPEKPAGLKTQGIYAFSRNPIYLGLDLLCVAACLMNFNVLTIGLAILTIILHHLIILSEEKYLALHYQQAWDHYKSRVRRYI